MDYKAKALELLGEKRSIGIDIYNNEDKNDILYNQMHSKAVDVVVGLLEELETCRDGNTFQKKRYYRLKGKLTVDKIDRILRQVEQTYDKEGNMDWLKTNQDEAIAILKYLEATNDK